MNNKKMQSISPSELHQLILSKGEENIELIDVRPRKMYDSRRVEQAEFVEFTTLNPEEVMTSRRLEASEPLYIICQLGIRSVQACEQFIAAGFDNVVNVESGTKAWAKKGLPTIGTKKGFSCPITSRIKQWLASRAA